MPNYNYYVYHTPATSTNDETYTYYPFDHPPHLLPDVRFTKPKYIYNDFSERFFPVHPTLFPPKMPWKRQWLRGAVEQVKGIWGRKMWAAEAKALVKRGRMWEGRYYEEEEVGEKGFDGVDFGEEEGQIRGLGRRVRVSLWRGGVGPPLRKRGG